MKLELSLHTIICGRTRKNIRLIEAATKTAIYFPPPFPRIYGYTPSGAYRRGEDEVYITGENQDCIGQAKLKLRELVLNTKCYVKEVMVSAHKIDSILLDRLDKVRKVMETNGSYVLFPQLGSQRGVIRVQGTEILQVERTVREIMALVSFGCLINTPCPLLSSSRLVNSTRLHGGCICHRMRRKVMLCEYHRQQILAQCSLISARTLAQMLDSISSPSQSTAQMILSRLP